MTHNLRTAAYYLEATLSDENRREELVKVSGGGKLRCSDYRLSHRGGGGQFRDRSWKRFRDHQWK